MFDNFGALHAELEGPEREKLTETMTSLLEKMMAGLCMDDAADEHCKQFLNRRQPPVVFAGLN